jgi:calcium permeable stress-gated cation channel
MILRWRSLLLVQHSLTFRRYNFLFVYNADIDTKGRIFPRALQHLFVGLYIAEVCLIGLFAIGTGSSVGALGPMILMIIFLIFTALYHIALNSALTPLLMYLPKSMDAEERRLLVEEHAAANGGRLEEGGYAEGEKYPAAGVASANGNGYPHAAGPASPTPQKKPGMFAKFLRPDKYQDYASMRRLVPKDVDINYDEQTAETAFFHPAITNITPLLWVPRDTMGVSQQECAQTGQVIPITDEGAFLDDKNKIVWVRYTPSIVLDIS